MLLTLAIASKHIIDPLLVYARWLRPVLRVDLHLWLVRLVPGFTGLRPFDGQAILIDHHAGIGGVVIGLLVGLQLPFRKRDFRFELFDGALGDGDLRDVLREMADQTGGEAFFERDKDKRKEAKNVFLKGDFDQIWELKMEGLTPDERERLEAHRDILEDVFQVARGRLPKNKLGIRMVICF